MLRMAPAQQRLEADDVFGLGVVLLLISKRRQTTNPRCRLAATPRSDNAGQSQDHRTFSVRRRAFLKCVRFLPDFVNHRGSLANFAY